MSQQDAIEEASARVSELQEISPGRWCYHIWSPEEGAWIPGVRADAHAEASRKRTSTIVAMAADALVNQGKKSKDPDLTWQIIGMAYGPDNDGSLTDRVRRILEELGDTRRP